MFTEIECPKCNRVIDAKGIIPQVRKADCNYCRFQFDIKKDLEINIRRKNPIYQPQDMEFLKTHKNLEFKFSLLNLPKGCAFWPIFFSSILVLLILIFIFLYFNPAFQALLLLMYSDSFISFLFFVAFLLFMCFSLANTAKRINNVTTLTLVAQPNKLSIPTLRTKASNQKIKASQIVSITDIDPSKILQFYVIELFQLGHFSYSLKALTKENEYIDIVTVIKNLPIALFIEQELEAFYNIKDLEVTKEIKA